MWRKQDVGDIRCRGKDVGEITYPEPRPYPFCRSSSSRRTIRPAQRSWMMMSRQIPIPRSEGSPYMPVTTYTIAWQTVISIPNTAGIDREYGTIVEILHIELEGHFTVVQFRLRFYGDRYKRWTIAVVQRSPQTPEQSIHMVKVKVGGIRDPRLSI